MSLRRRDAKGGNPAISVQQLCGRSVADPDVDQDWSRRAFANRAVSRAGYGRRMTSSNIVRFVNPWKFRREQNEQRVKALRGRDGDTCRRCKRPLRFDLPDGHDLRPRVEQILCSSAGGNEDLGNLVLCHIRCNAKDGHDTAAVKERVRLKSEAELFASSRKRRKTA